MRFAALLLAGVAATVGGRAVTAQPATRSPHLERFAGRDTVLTVWVFARPDRTLDETAAAVGRWTGSIRRRSRWLHALSADVTVATLDSLAATGVVRHIQPVRRFRAGPIPRAPSAAPPDAAPQLDSLYGAATTQMRMLNLFPLAEEGFRGANVTIAIFDTGFENLVPTFQTTTVAAEFDFVFNDGTVRNESGDAPGASGHGTGTWSMMAADVPGTMIGVAPDAAYLLAKTEDVRSETRAEEDNLVAALEWADSLGAQVVSISLGYTGFDDGFAYTPNQFDGDVAVTTVAVDMAVARGIVVVAAAGNGGAAGSGSISTPGDADSVLTVGAIDSLGNLANFSGRGPTADGRTKPELVALGVSAFRAVGSSFARSNGTSFATPIMAGAVALLLEIHPTLTPIEIRDALLGAASNRDSPDSQIGWGVPDVTLAATFPRGIAFSGTAAELTTVTPSFAWNAADVPAFAAPVTYRFVAAVDSTFTTTLLDTTTTALDVTLGAPLRPGSQPVFQLTATGANGAFLTVASPVGLTVPPWTTLGTFNDSAGTTTENRRPTFTWSSPGVTTPPGPFRYDVAVFRGDGTVDAAATDLTVSTFTPDSDLGVSTPYRWRVTAKLGGDTATVESAGDFLVIDESVPAITSLFQNFPNPFPNLAVGTDATCIWFDLASDGEVRLDVLDLRGHVVRTLVPAPGLGPTLPAGRYGRAAGGAGGRCDPEFEWDGRADDGRVAPRGVYIIRLVTPDGVLFKRSAFLGNE